MVLKPDQCEAIIRAAVKLPYWHRSYTTILNRAGEILDGADLRFALNRLQQINQKERDALALLDALAAELIERG